MRTEQDTLRVALQDGVVRLVGMLHGDGLWELSQHPLLEVLEPLVVVTATDKLLVLQRGINSSSSRINSRLTVTC